MPMPESEGARLAGGAARPLATLCLMCRNQESTIGEALGAALAQTYSPLEIVVSDDASTDGSWEVVTRLVAAYRGPHAVKLNRNPERLNVVGNFQKALALSRGELIVEADGDDVSYPDRVEALVADWTASGRRALVLCSSYDCVDARGRLVGERVFRGGWDDRGIEEHVMRVYMGGALAFHRSLVDAFRPTAFTRAMQDVLIHVRALLLRNDGAPTAAGKFRIVARKLLKYRVAVGVSGKGRYFPSRVRSLTRTIESYRQILLDVDALRDARLDALRAFVADYIDRLECTRTLYGTASFAVRARAFPRSHAASGRAGLRHRLIALFALLPPAPRDFLFDRLHALIRPVLYYWA